MALVIRLLCVKSFNPRDVTYRNKSQFVVWNSMEKFKFIDLFAGIGGIRLGFESVGGKCVFSSEWDSFAQDTYEANFGERPFGDITKINPETIPDHDILLGGFPCQAFSICGNQKGFADTRGTLFFNIEEILRVKSPFAFMLENVKNLKSHDKGRTFKTIVHHLEDLGYFVHHTVLNSLDFGVPQKSAVNPNFSTTILSGICIPKMILWRDADDKKKKSLFR
jgi:DNA (cytosine-5)-methyltransferase 1